MENAERWKFGPVGTVYQVGPKEVWYLRMSALRKRPRTLYREKKKEASSNREGHADLRVQGAKGQTFNLKRESS